MTPIAAEPAARPLLEGGAPTRRTRSAADAPASGFAEALGAATAAAADDGGERDRVGVDGEVARGDHTSPEAAATEAPPASAADTFLANPMASLDSWSAWLHWTAARAHDDGSAGADDGAAHKAAATDPIDDASGASVAAGAVVSAAPGHGAHASPASGAIATTTTREQGLGASSPSPTAVQGAPPIALPPAETSGKAVQTDAPGQAWALAWNAPAPPPDVASDVTAPAVPAARDLAGSAARPPASADPAIVAVVTHDQDAGVPSDVTLENLLAAAQSGGSAEAGGPEGSQGMHRIEPAFSTRTDSSAAAPLHSPLVVPSGEPARVADAFDVSPSVEPSNTGDTATAVVDQVVKSLRVQWKQGIGEARIQLRPEHLGPVDISLKVEGGAVTAVVRAESTQVQEWILGHQQSLRQQLEDAGLRLADLVVSPDAERQRQRGEQQAEDGRPPSRRRRADEAEPIFEVIV